MSGTFGHKPEPRKTKSQRRRVSVHLRSSPSFDFSPVVTGRFTQDADGNLAVPAALTGFPAPPGATVFFPRKLWRLA